MGGFLASLKKADDGVFYVFKTAFTLLVVVQISAQEKRFHVYQNPDKNDLVMRKDFFLCLGYLYPLKQCRAH